MESHAVPGSPQPVIDHPSPNFGPRRGGLSPSLIVLHYTAMDSAERARDWLCDPESQVSSHYLIGRDGRIWRLVDEAMRAWHAGAGDWKGQDDINSRSIGIELDNDGGSPFSEPLMSTLEGLLDDLMHRHGIPAAGVIAHSDLAPGRKIDPGPRFDWRRLAMGGRAVWPEPAPGGQFRADATRAGYPTEPDDNTILAAFRSRFRPGATGPLCDADRELVAGLAALDAGPERA